MQTIIGYVALAAFVIVIGDFIKAYSASTATGWARVLDAGRGSATILAAQLGVAAATLTASANKIIDYATSIAGDQAAAPQIKAALSSYLTPENIGIVGAAFAVLTVVGRMRTLGK